MFTSKILYNSLISLPSFVDYTNRLFNLIMLKEESNESGFLVGKEDDDREVASWLMLNPGKDSDSNNNGFLFGVEYLDLVDYSSSFDNQFEDQYSQYQRSFGGEDGVVPLQVEESASHLEHSHHYNYDGALKDLNHTVSLLRYITCFPLNNSLVSLTQMTENVFVSVFIDISFINGHQCCARVNRQ